ncbi:MAG: MFS transporter [Alicyclobacillus sp.]|nr:MFS transporter [Alicyclobacillus sp.]
MEQWQKNLWLLWIGAFVTSASYSMVVPFLPLFLLKIGVHHTELWSGWIFSAPFLMGALISPYWGSLADKYGRKPMILRSGFALCFCYLTTALVTNPYELLGLRLLQGLLAGYIPGAIALVATNTPEKQVGYALALMSTATATGNIIGPMLGGSIARLFDNQIAFCSAGVLVLFATLLVLFWVKEHQFVPSKTRSSVIGAFRTAIHNRPLLVVLFLVTFTAFSIMTIEPVLPLYIAQLGGGSVKNASFLAGIVFSLAGIASIVFAPRWGKLSGKIGFRKVLIIGLLGGGLGNLAQIFVHNVWGFAAVRFGYGAFFCAVFPALNGLVVENTEPEFRGRAFGLSQTSNQIGTMLGPMVGGALGERFGVHNVFAVTGVLLLATMGLAYWSRNHAARSTDVSQVAANSSS